MTKPARVAVIGGGCAALAAAFELTRPELSGRYVVSVYQEGFRLGGKGASGRGAGDRIEEHGLHLWMGFYENAFRLMRECYAELARDPEKCRISRWTDAFSPVPFVGVAERAGADWEVWQALIPPMPGLPGDPPGARRMGAFDYFLRTLELLRALLRTLPGAGAAGAEAPPREQAQRRLQELLRYGELATLTAVIEALGVLEVGIGSFARLSETPLLRFFDALSASARAEVARLVEGDPSLRRVWGIVDITLATLRGELRFGIFADPRGFDAIDDYDCREWLLLNGASPSSLDSGFVRGLYDLVFAYEDGDAERPRVAAGQALRSVVRAFFTYRGAFFWKMNAGMGDVVFAPLYEVLARRGVRFEFFHRLRDVRISAEDSGEPHVEALELDVQALVTGGREYAPLVDVRGLPCWPAEADYRQLEDGERLAAERVDFESAWERRRAATRTLRVAQDFDFVVLGIGLGAVPETCRELVSRDARWRAMIDHVKTVPTQALQIWLRESMPELGWRLPTGAVSGFVKSFDTWADMSHLIPEESFCEAPRALAYFCSVLPEQDTGFAANDARALAAARAAVRRNAIRFLESDIAQLWPRAAALGGGFRWELLATPSGAQGQTEPASAADIDAQFLRANVNPSDRYAQTLPGSTRYRISPLDTGYDNLTIAGDWTQCGFNAGCVEAAVMSGRLAAHALSLSPPLDEIVGFDHP